MTRMPRREHDGKPLPAPPPVEWQEEPTVRTRMPTNEELEAELRQHAEAGPGPDLPVHIHRGVL